MTINTGAKYANWQDFNIWDYWKNDLGNDSPFKGNEFRNTNMQAALSLEKTPEANKIKSKYLTSNIPSSSWFLVKYQRPPDVLTDQIRHASFANEAYTGKKSETLSKGLTQKVKKVLYT